MLSFLAGIAGGMSEDIDRKRALADKKDLASEQLENQIKLMTEQRAIDERAYETRKKMDKVAAQEKQMNLYTSLNIPVDAAKSLSQAGKDLQPYILDYAKNNPETNWESVLKLKESTGDNITEVMQPNYVLNTSALFKREPDTFADLNTRLDSHMDALAAARISGDAKAIELAKKSIEVTKSLIAPNTEVDLLDGTRIASLRKSEIALSMGAFGTATNGGDFAIEAITAGETFQFAEEFSTFMESFKETTQPYLSNSANQQIVEANYRSNEKLLQQKLDSAMNNIEDKAGSDETIAQNKIVHQVNGENLIVNQGTNPTSMFRKIEANKNDLVKILFVNTDGSMVQQRVLWGGSFDSSIDSTGAFKYVSSTFGNNPFATPTN